MVDALLPRSKTDQRPLHITARNETSTLGPAWIPIAVKGYFKARGGYSIPGSNPAPDIYAFTGWIPEHLDLNSGFRREKEWKRLYDSWQKGQVILTLGSGVNVSSGMVPLHAYGVTSKALGVTIADDRRPRERRGPPVGHL